MNQRRDPFDPFAWGEEDPGPCYYCKDGPDDCEDEACSRAREYMERIREEEDGDRRRLPFAGWPKKRYL